jgi:hypothetical protein
MSKRNTRRTRQGTVTRILATGVAALLLAACGREPAAPAARTDRTTGRPGRWR